MNTIRIIVLGLVLAAFFASCGEDTPVITIDNPAAYEFEREGQSTVSFSGQTTRIDMATELITAMKDLNVTSEALLEMYANQSATGEEVSPFFSPDLNSSTKSIKSKVAASADFFSANTTESAEIKAEIETWLTAQTTEINPEAGQLASEGQAGQIADGSSVRYVSAKGLEYNQAVNKTLIGALMVDQISNNYLSTTVLDADSNRAENDAGTVAEGKAYTTMEHKWDEAYGYLFGKATDAAEPLASLGGDSFLNKYLARVDGDEDFSGIANEIFEAFKLGRSAIVAGDYAERDAQAQIINESLAELVAVRAIYYLQNGKKALAAGDMGGAFHDLSEGFGFVYSLRFLRKSNSIEPYFSSQNVRSYIDQLTAGNGFWTVSAETLDQISAEIATEFDFTVEQAAE